MVGGNIVEGVWQQNKNVLAINCHGAKAGYFVRKWHLNDFFNNHQIPPAQGANKFSRLERGVGGGLGENRERALSSS